jgi:hypothetical protein
LDNSISILEISNGAPVSSQVPTKPCTPLPILMASQKAMHQWNKIKQKKVINELTEDKENSGKSRSMGFALWPLLLRVS